MQWSGFTYLWDAFDLSCLTFPGDVWGTVPPTCCTELPSFRNSMWAPHNVANIFKFLTTRLISNKVTHSPRDWVIISSVFLVVVALYIFNLLSGQYLFQADWICRCLLLILILNSVRKHGERNVDPEKPRVPKTRSVIGRKI